MHIVRNINTPKEATTLDGKKVHREEKLYVPEMQAFIPCASYSNHFIYANPSTKKGQPCYLCTCGSLAVVIGSNAYAQDQSPSGALFVCHCHATFSRHSDGTK
jgi:hypothetical protein